MKFKELLNEAKTEFRKGQVVYLEHGRSNYSYEKVKIIKVTKNREVGIQQGDIDTLYTIKRSNGETLEVQDWKLSKKIKKTDTEVDAYGDEII
jgi:hypothetical protein